MIIKKENEAFNPMEKLIHARLNEFKDSEGLYVIKAKANVSKKYPFPLSPEKGSFLVCELEFTNGAKVSLIDSLKCRLIGIEQIQTNDNVTLYLNYDERNVINQKEEIIKLTDGIAGNNNLKKSK
jgi:hypothetical protein